MREVSREKFGQKYQVVKGIRWLFPIGEVICLLYEGSFFIKMPSVLVYYTKEGYGCRMALF